MRYSTVLLEGKRCRKNYSRAFLAECRPLLAIHCAFLGRMKKKREGMCIRPCLNFGNQTSFPVSSF